MNTSCCRSAIGLILGAMLFVGCSSSSTSPQPPVQPETQPVQPETQPQVQSEAGTAQGEAPGIQSEAGAITPSTGPFHIETWAYDSGIGEGKTAPASLVARYVTFAESVDDNKVLTDCHTVAPRCKALHIINASRIYTFWDPSDTIKNSSENWWLHKRGYTDFAHRIVTTNNRLGYLVNESVLAAQTYWQSYVRRQFGAYDGLMTDDMSITMADALSSTNATAIQEITTDAQVLSMRQAFSAKMTKVTGVPFYVVQNGVNANPFVPHGLSRIGPSVHGLISEGVPVAAGVITAWYPNLLDLMSQVNATSGFIVLLSYGSGTSSVARPADRYVHTATVWFGYSPGHEVSWEDFEGGTRLNVFPEATIYPTQPVQTMSASTGNKSLLVQAKVWRREFRACYLRGTLWGHCAALANTNSTAVALQSTWLTQTYSNAIQVVGADVQDSTAHIALGTKPTSIPAHGAVLLYGK